MHFQHLPTSSLNAYIKHYTNLLLNGCNNPENVDSFLRSCYNELRRRENDIYNKK